MLRDHDAAWETSQETFLRALRTLDQFKGDASFYTWLYRIAVNLAIDYQRHEWRRPTVAAVPEATIEAQEAVQEDLRRDDPFRRVTDREIGERVRAAIDQL